MKEENVDLSQIKPFPIEKGAELPPETQEEVNKKLKEMADRDELMKQNGINIELGSTESKSDAVAAYNVMELEGEEDAVLYPAINNAYATALDIPTVGNIITMYSEIDKVLSVEKQQEFLKKAQKLVSSSPISKEDLATINSYLSQKGFEQIPDLQDKKEEVNKNTPEQTQEPNSQLSEADSLAVLEQLKVEEPKKEPLPVSDAPLEQAARENRKYEILKRERAVSEAERSRNRATMFAGLCILGTLAAGLLTGNDINQLVQDELNILKGSWESLGNYFKNLGPLADALGLCAIAFGGKIGIFERKLRNARLDLEDYMSSLEETNELGGNENARTR